MTHYCNINGLTTKQRNRLIKLMFNAEFGNISFKTGKEETGAKK